MAGRTESYILFYVFKMYAPTQIPFIPIGLAIVVHEKGGEISFSSGFISYGFDHVGNTGLDEFCDFGDVMLVDNREEPNQILLKRVCL